jgi:hypothetical protein
VSVKQMALVWELDLAPNKRLVLLAYADHADEHGNNVFPSLARIAHKTGYSRDQVRRISRELNDDQLMELVAPATSTKPAEYSLTLERGSKLPPLTPRRVGADNPSPPGANDPSGVGAPVPPEPSLEPSGKPSSPPVVPPKGDRPQKRKRIKAENAIDYAAAYEEFVSDDPLGSKLARLVKLAGAENKTGQITFGRACNEFIEGLRQLREEGLSEEALRSGLSEAIKNQAPNMNYVKKVARNFAPAQQTSISSLPMAREGDVNHEGMTRKEREAERRRQMEEVGLAPLEDDVDTTDLDEKLRQMRKEAS